MSLNLEFSGIKDQPESIMVDHTTDALIIEFADARSWLRFTPDHALEFAKAIAEHCDKITEKILLVEVVDGYVEHRGNNVIMQFGKPYKHLKLSPEQGLAIANALITHAELASPYATH